MSANRPPLTPNQKRIRVMQFSFPLLVATGYILYKRLVLGEEQRKLKPGQQIAVRPGMMTDPTGANQ